MLRGRCHWDGLLRSSASNAEPAPERGERVRLSSERHGAALQQLRCAHMQRVGLGDARTDSRSLLQLHCPSTSDLQQPSALDTPASTHPAQHTGGS